MTFSWLKDRVRPSHASSQRQQLSSPSAPKNHFTEEGTRLCQALWLHFWNHRHQHFTTAKASSDTVGGWNGYTIWPFSVGIEALLEAEHLQPGGFAEEIHSALAAFEKFRSRKRRGGYCAWVWFEGNDEVYYDDDAQVAIALLRAYELPSVSRKEYLDRSREIVDFLFTGWDAENGGGMHWHVSKPQRNACSTNLSAIAALKLAGTYCFDPISGIRGEFRDGNVQGLLGFAKKCSDWVCNELLAESGLIKDGADGGPTWTYNTGAALTVVCLLHRFFPENREFERRAVSLADAATDRRKSLYDLSCPAENARYWWDSTFFMQLLVEGLVEFVETFGAKHPELATKVKGELRRHMEYTMAHLKGEQDGLYVRNLRLYVISAKHLQVYKELTGDNGREAELDESERWKDAGSMKLPVDQRGIAKSLLGNGGAARSLLLAGRILT